MKKNLFLAATLLATTVISAQSNLVVNGDFETGTLAPWQKGFTQSYTEPTLDAANARGNGYGVGYDNPAKTTGFYQQISITENTTYTISFWYKSTGDGSDSRLWSYFLTPANSVKNLDNNTANDKLRGPNNGWLNTSADWVQYTDTFTSPAGIDRFVYAFRAYTGGTVSFDDIVLQEGNLATVDFSKSKFSLVKYTQVNDVIEFAKNSKVNIYNMSSQLVKQINVSADEKVSVADLPAGMYIVTGDVNGEKVSQKILKK